MSTRKNPSTFTLQVNKEPEMKTTANGENTPSTTTPRKRLQLHSGRLGNNLVATLLLLPAGIFFLLFSVYPILSGLLLSFQWVDLVGPSEWVGLDNFRYVITDPLFVTAWRNTIQFTFFGMVFGYFVPALLAIAVNEMRSAGSFFRFALFLPSMLPPLVTIFLWKWLYDPDAGLLNSLFALIGVPKLLWLQSPQTAMIALVILATWVGAGGTMLIYLAALQGIPSHLYEAASIDGAGILQRLWHITLPQLRTIMLYMLILQIIGTMQVFTEPFVLTGGGPSNSTNTVMMLVYQHAFVNADFGSAAAMSLILFFVLIAFTLLYLRIMRRTVGMGRF